MSSYADLSHTEKAKADTLILTLHGQFPSAPLALLEEVAAEAVENGESEAVAADHLRARLGIATEAPPAAFEMVLRQIDVGVVSTLFDFLRTFLDQPGALPRVLVLGDGDLSFSRSLQTLLCLGPRLTATVFNPSDTPPDLRDNKRWLQGAGVDVREGVDVMRLQPDLAQPGLFDVVIFNFPHNGLNAHSEVKWGNKKLNIETHNYLLERYFAMSKSVLKPHGFAVVSVKRQKPYVWWNTREIGSLFFSDCKQLRFDPSEFGGYRHTRTLPRQRQVETKKAFSFVFYRPTLTDRVRSDYDYQRILQRALAAQRRLPPVDWSSSEDEEDVDGVDEHIVYQPEADGALW